MTAGTPPFERLQVIRDDVPRSGALNMAHDEVLLNDAAGAPVLRFYQWARPAVSFGYFGPVDSARRVARDREIVRRLTGGGIVEHGDDVTYTLVVPRAEVFTRLRSEETYRMIHAAVALALGRCGLGSQSHAATPSLLPAEDGPGACFERPVLHDLMAGGKKVAGGAQRRNRIGLLHQGSFRLGLRSGLDWEQCLRAELPPALAHDCQPRTLTAGEIARAEALAAARYATATWTNRV